VDKDTHSPENSPETGADGSTARRDELANEEQTLIKKQVRQALFIGIAAILMLVLGYFAGQAVKDMTQDGGVSGVVGVVEINEVNGSL